MGKGGVTWAGNGKQWELGLWAGECPSVPHTSLGEVGMGQRGIGQGMGWGKGVVVGVMSWQVRQ